MPTSKDSTRSNDSAAVKSVVGVDEILEVLPDLIFEISPEGIYQAIHSGPADDLYRAPEETVGCHISEILPEETSEKCLAAVQEVLETGETVTIDYLLPGGEEDQFFAARLMPLSNGNVLAVVRNMTQNWRAKSALEQSESRYRTLVNNLPGLVYRCHTDEEWSAVFVSESVRDFVGFPPEDFLTGRRTLAGITHPEDRVMVRKQVMAALARKEPFELWYRLVDQHGEIHHVTERGQAIFANHDQVEYLDGVILDVTEIHRMRERVLVNSKMAAVGSLAAGVAHEINNPLAIAVANIDFVREELQAHTQGHATSSFSEMEQALDTVNSGISRVQAIIDDLRTFSDAADSRAAEVKLPRIVSWAAERSRVRRASTTATQLTTTITTVPPIWASEVALVQMLWNLLDNSFEAVETLEDEGQVELTLSYDASEDTVVLEVRDNGPGMPPSVALQAFDPFFTTKPVGEGSGLGLFVCKGLVEGMDGTIDVTSDLGEGTTVRVSFPAFQPIYSQPAGE